MADTHHEGLKGARLLMVLGSTSPLFILWAIRGSSIIRDEIFIPFCILMVIVPNAALYRRILVSKKNFETKQIFVEDAEDHRDHLLIYLFAMLLPFYAIDLDEWRGFVAALVAIGFIVFLFWYLNLHYLNIFFALFKYRVYTIRPPCDNNPYSGKCIYLLITRRITVTAGEKIIANRISDTVYLEMG